MGSYIDKEYNRDSIIRFGFEKEKVNEAAINRMRDRYT